MKTIDNKQWKTIALVNFVLCIMALIVCILVLNEVSSLAKTLQETKQTAEVKLNEERRPQLQPAVEVAPVEKVEEPVVQPKPVEKPQQLASRGKTVASKETIQGYVREICKKYPNIKPELIMAVIEKESGYRPSAKNGNCLGLMQVSTRWHYKRAEKLGVKDFYDPYGNVLLGTDYLSDLMEKYQDPAFVLMIYNMGPSSASKMYNQGQISAYAKSVLATAEKYRKGE